MCSCSSERLKEVSRNVVAGFVSISLLLLKYSGFLSECSNASTLGLRFSLTVVISEMVPELRGCTS